jgi:hypothetical protein
MTTQEVNAELLSTVEYLPVCNISADIAAAAEERGMRGEVDTHSPGLGNALPSVGTGSCAAGGTSGAATDSRTTAARDLADTTVVVQATGGGGGCENKSEAEGVTTKGEDSVVGVAAVPAEAAVAVSTSTATSVSTSAVVFAPGVVSASTSSPQARATQAVDALDAAVLAAVAARAAAAASTPPTNLGALDARLRTLADILARITAPASAPSPPVTTADSLAHSPAEVMSSPPPRGTVQGAITDAGDAGATLTAAAAAAAARVARNAIQQQQQQQGGGGTQRGTQGDTHEGTLFPNCHRQLLPSPSPSPSRPPLRVSRLANERKS